MFARGALRFSSRAVVRNSSFTKLAPRATFHASSIAKDPEVPVISYRKGERREEAIQYDGASNTGPVSPPGADIEKAAIPLNSEVAPHLTPTLQKFTLLGKVAVVTGFVCSTQFRTVIRLTSFTVVAADWGSIWHKLLQKLAFAGLPSWMCNKSLETKPHGN